MQRVIEAHSIPTSSITLVRTLTERVKPPRALHVRWPAGHPFGEPHRPEQQLAMLKQALRLLLDAREPGAIVDLPYLYKGQAYAPESISLEP